MNVSGKRNEYKIGAEVGFEPCRDRYSYDLDREREGYFVKPLDLTTFADLGASLAALGWSKKPEINMIDAVYLYRRLSALIKDKTFSLGTSKESILQLIEALDKFMDISIDEDSNVEKRTRVATRVKSLCESAKTILFAELKNQNCYVVAPKRAYSVQILTEDATKIFSNEAYLLMTDVERYDIQQAGKCLAFETPTAAGFHLVRAMDSVLRRYHAIVTGKTFSGRFRAWGTYIEGLRKHGANEQVVSVIEQVKNLHRNPIVHPDLQMTMDQAISFIGIAESLISAILGDMASRVTEEANDALAAASVAAKADPLRLDLGDLA